MAIELPPSLELGKLLRLHGMVSVAAQTEVARDAGAALVRAYMGLREELLVSLSSDETDELRDEFERLFAPLEDPGEFAPSRPTESNAQLLAAAQEGRLRLGQLGGWIQGLINELTFDQRLRAEAEAIAREQAKSQTGFG